MKRKIVNNLFAFRKFLCVFFKDFRNIGFMLNTIINFMTVMEVQFSKYLEKDSGYRKQIKQLTTNSEVIDAKIFFFITCLP